MGVMATWPAGARTGTQTWTLLPDQQAVIVWSALKPLNNLCGVQNLFRSVEDAEIKVSDVTISMLKPRL